MDQLADEQANFEMSSRKRGRKGKVEAFLCFSVSFFIGTANLNQVPLDF